MISSRSLISKSPCPCTDPLVTNNSTNYNWYNRHSHVSQLLFFFFNSLTRSKDLFFFSLSISFTTETAKSTIRQVLFFAVDYYKVISYGRDEVTRLYLKVPKGFVVLIRQEIWIFHILFICMIKLQFLAQVPTDYLALQLLSSLILFL